MGSREQNGNHSQSPGGSNDRLGIWFGVVLAAHVLIVWIVYALMFRDVEIPEKIPNERKPNNSSDSSDSNNSNKPKPLQWSSPGEFKIVPE